MDLIKELKKLYEKKTTVRHALGFAPPGMCAGVSDYSAWLK